MNAYDVKAGICVIAGKTVWSMPERLECDVLHKVRYINTVTFFLFFTRHSLVRAKGEVLVLLYVFCSVLSTISRQPAGRFKPNFACGRTLVPDVSSPLLGVSGLRLAEKGENEIFVTIVSSTDALVSFKL